VKTDYSRKEDCYRCGGTGKEIDFKALVKIREEANKTQQEVAKKMDISPTYLSDLEHGRRSWTGEKVEKFLEAIGK